MSPDVTRHLPMISDFLIQIGIATGLGFLVGLERERAVDEVAGVRTFPLITVLGVVTGSLGEAGGGWVVGAALLALTALIVTGNVARMKRQEPDPGITTEVSALLMFAVGAGLAAGLTTPAVVVGGGVAVLLHLRHPLHELADRIDPDEFKAIIRLALIALVVLPLLPNRSFGPYQVLNPFQIWLMVVLIVGISLGAYVGYRLFGQEGGTALAGVLGGFISSTATTVSYARRSARAPGRAPGAAVVVTLASTVVFVRVLLEISVVAPGTLPATGPPLLVMTGVMALISMGLYFRARSALAPELADQDPPSELGPAVIFGVLYAVVLLAVAAAREHLGTSGLYMVAGLSGLTDMDAITLSTAQLVRTDQLDPGTGWRLIVVGALANLAFKAGVIAVIGHRRLLRRIAGAWILAVVAGVLLIRLWPA